MPADPEPLKWEQTPHPGWLEEVEKWPWQEWNVHDGPKEGWKKIGQCPRCHHQMGVYSILFRGVAKIARDTLRARCNCDYEHPGRPNDEDGGCGQSGVVGGVS